MTRTTAVDTLLDRCSELQGQRDRAFAQRAAYEGHLWHAETLLKQVARLLPEMIVVNPTVSVHRDSLLEQIVEFINEPRHHTNIPVVPGGDGVPMASSGDAGHDGEPS